MQQGGVFSRVGPNSPQLGGEIEDEDGEAKASVSPSWSVCDYISVYPLASCM